MFNYYEMPMPQFTTICVINHIINLFCQLTLMLYKYKLPENENSCPFQPKWSKEMYTHINCLKTQQSIPYDWQWQPKACGWTSRSHICSGSWLFQKNLLCKPSPKQRPIRKLSTSGSLLLESMLHLWNRVSDGRLESWLLLS